MKPVHQRFDDPTVQALENRLALGLAGALSQQTSALPHDVIERLRFAREQSLEKGRNARLAAPAGQQVLAVSVSGSAALGSTTPWWQRTLGVLPLLLLVAGLLMIQEFSVREQMLATAEVDAVLLADQLPPAAYSDPGFGEYLRSPPP